MNDQGQAISRLIGSFERAGFEISREGRDGFRLREPFWGLDERVRVTLQEDGTARFRFEYFTLAQVLVHVAISAIFALNAWTSPVPDPMGFVCALTLSHAAAAAIVLGSFAHVRARFSREVFRAKG